MTTTFEPGTTTDIEISPDRSSVAVAVIVVFCIALAVLGLVSLLGNGVVLGTLRYAWTTVGAKPGNFLAFMLAIADLLNTVTNLPMVLVGAIYGRWHDSPGLRIAHFFFLTMLSGASNMLLCVISINRYAVVAKPNTSEKVGRRRAQNLAILACCHSLAAATISTITWVVLGYHDDQLIPPTSVQFISYGLIVVAPMVTMTVTYVRLFRRVKMRVRAVGARRCNNPCTVSQIASQSIAQDGPSVFGTTKPANMILTRPTKRSRRHADLRTAITLLILLGIFVLCWTPIMVLTLLVNFSSFADHHLRPIYLTVAAAMVFLIPACNPLVYSLRNAQFRAAASDFLLATKKRMTAPCRRKKRELEAAENGPDNVP